MPRDLQTIGIGLLLAALLLQLSLSESTAANRTSVRIGLVSSMGKGLPDEVRQAVLIPFRSLMEAQTGLAGELATGGDTFALARKLSEGTIDLGFFHGHEYAWARARDPKLQALAICVNQSTETTVHLVVHKNSRFRQVSELKGRTAALPRVSKGHTRLFFERRCVTNNLNPTSFYREVRMPFDIPQALDEVVNHQAACAVVESGCLANYKKLRPAKAAQLRTLLESEPFPSGVIAYYDGRLAAEEVRRLREGLLATKDNARGQAILGLLRLTGFEAPPEDHDKCLEKIAKAYPANLNE